MGKTQLMEGKKKLEKNASVLNTHESQRKCRSESTRKRASAESAEHLDWINRRGTNCIEFRDRNGTFYDQSF